MRTLVISMLLAVAPAAALADPPIVTELSMTGSVDRAVVDRVLDDTLTIAADCYSAVQTAQDKLRVTNVAVKFRIDAQGKVPTASATGVASVNTCIATKLKAHTFPVPSGKVDITMKLSTLNGQSILGSTALAQGGAFASLTGTGDINSGFDDTNIYGGLLGNEAGEMNGGFGFGGGTTPAVKIGTAIVSTDADKDAIRGRIQRDIGKLRACYQKALATDARLAGKVTVKFRIEPTGKVSSATGSGLATVDACVAMVIAAIEFIKPTAGGVVDVSYPFVFFQDAVPGTGVSGKSAAVPTVSIGQANAKGDLDKAIIRRYVKRNIQKIQYCYEKQLLATPGLAGTVTLSFNIGVDGKVTRSTGTGLANVDTCVASVIQGIEFPKPKNGDVEVSYPFVFKPGA